MSNNAWDQVTKKLSPTAFEEEGNFWHNKCEDQIEAVEVFTVDIWEDLDMVQVKVFNDDFVNSESALAGSGELRDTELFVDAMRNRRYGNS